MTKQIKQVATTEEYIVVRYEDDSIGVYNRYGNTKAALRKIAEEHGFEYNTNWTTRQFGKKLIDEVGNGAPAIADNDYIVYIDANGAIICGERFEGDTKEGLRTIAEKYNIPYEKGWNTHQFGRKVIEYLLNTTTLDIIDSKNKTEESIEDYDEDYDEDEEDEEEKETITYEDERIRFIRDVSIDVAGYSDAMWLYDIISKKFFFFRVEDGIGSLEYDIKQKWYTEEDVEDFVAVIQVEGTRAYIKVWNCLMKYLPRAIELVIQRKKCEEKTDIVDYFVTPSDKGAYVWFGPKSAYMREL